MTRHLLRRLMTVASVTLLVGGCGGSHTPSPSPSPAVSGTASTEATVTSSRGVTPGELGDQIGAAYVAALKDVTNLLENKPAAAGAMANVKVLKEKYVHQLVELGKKRELLGVADRATVDSAVRSAIGKTANEPWYVTYGDINRHYLNTDRELSNLVASFNIIGQYAAFELLKEQEPAEAARLGIK